MSTKTTRILIAAGGTAGHLAPALAIADELKAAGHNITFAASSGRRDAEMITQRGYEAQLFAIGGLPRKPGVAQVKAIMLALKAVFSCFVILRTIRPNAVLAGGGFVAAPVAIAAWLQRIPVIATEADAHLGLANRMSGRVARRLCTAYPLPKYRHKQEVVGRPVAPEFFEVSDAKYAARESLGLPKRALSDDARVVVVVGGSGGATRMNEAAIGAWGAQTKLEVDGRPLFVLHVTGRRDYKMVMSSPPKSENYRVIEYCEDMPNLLAAADLVVTRPGGGIFELAAVGRAAIMVPSPNVTNDHQTLNAQHFVKNGGGVLADDAGLTPEHLRDLVNDLLASRSDARRAELAAGIKKLARPNAARRIAQLVEQCAQAHARRSEVNQAGADEPEVDETKPLADQSIHFVGAGGAGVSALAQLAHAWGAEVSACDRADSEYAQLVRASGVSVETTHDPDHIKPGMKVVVSSALPKEHPELVRARELGCEVILRGVFLGELTRIKPSVVVAGAHGKSTTTGMLAHAATICELDPAVAIGATLDALRDENGAGGNVRAGDGLLIVEGDESDRTLLELSAKIAVVTNIERDHHHTFATDDEVEELFAQWVRSQANDCVLIAGPGEKLDELSRHAPGRVIRFGQDEDEIQKVATNLAVPGRHNALNALAARAVLVELGVEVARAENALNSFTGVGRRFEKIGGKISAETVAVVDDYAHHPTEITATIEAARRLADPHNGRVLVVYEPHLFSRTEALWKELATALSSADRVWITPIYPSREQPIPGVTSKLVADQLTSLAPSVYAGEGVADVVTGDIATIISEVKPGDLLVTMGAGSITKLAPRLWDKLADKAGMRT